MMPQMVQNAMQPAPQPEAQPQVPPQAPPQVPTQAQPDPGEPKPASAEAGDTATSPMEKLKKLKESFDLGVLTQEEYDEKKKKLMDMI